MLRRVNRRALVKRLCVLAALAGAAVCALEGFPDAAAGVDGGEPVATAVPETETGPGPAGLPDAGSGLLSRRRFRRWKRTGAPGVPDGGIPVWRDAGAPRDAGHDLVARGAFVPRVVTPPVVVAPPPAPPVPSTPSTSQPVTDLGFNTCQKIPRGKRVVKLNLKPEVELPELVAWISSVTCKSFVLPGSLSAGGKKITFVTQGAMTRDEAYAVFLSAIDSIGLTVERRAGYYMIIESSKAKMSSMPVYGFDGQPTRGSPSGSGD